MDFLENFLNILTLGIYGKFQDKDIEISKLRKRIDELESTYKKLSDINVTSLNTGKIKIRLKSYRDLNDKQKLFVQENDFIFKDEGIIYLFIENNFKLSYPENTRIFNIYLQKDLFEFYEESEE